MNLSNKQVIEDAFQTSQEKIIEDIWQKIKDNFSSVKESASRVTQESVNLQNIFKESADILNKRQLIAQNIKKRRENKEIYLPSGRKSSISLKTLQKNRDRLEATAEYKNIIAKIITARKELQTAIGEFQSKIGLLRNQIFRIFYLVTEEGGINPTVVTAPLEYLVKYSYSPIDKEVDLSFTKSFNQIDKEIETIIGNLSALLELKNEPAIVQLSNSNIEDLNMVYQATYQRRQSQFLEPKEQRTLKKKKEIVAVFLEHKIMFYYILNLGDIGEGYLSFYFSDKKFNSQSDEEKIQQFITEGVLPVNNQSGFLQEDFQFKVESQTIQGAAKALNASVGGIKQIIKFAEKITNMTSSEELVKEDIAKFIYTEADRGIRNSFIGQVEEASEEAVRLAIESMADSLDKKRGLKQLRAAPYGI